MLTSQSCELSTRPHFNTRSQLEHALNSSSFKRRLIRNFLIYLGLSVGECSNKTQFTSYPFSAPLQFGSYLLLTSFQSVFWSSLSFLLTLLFASYSPFCISLLMSALVFLLACFDLLFALFLALFAIFPTR